MMKRITGDMIINQALKDYPETIPVFHKFKVDTCCGGGGSIAQTASRDGIDVDELLNALNKAIEA
ncbi:MAG: DUF542 domain-containing protein [Candidatus Omnitrophica bacterium]|nr:DUF542 domain-containing protein [Candidatus Omnitrophota bacterium]